jgi:hypothetical protein
MKAPTWKQQLVIAAFLALHVQLVVRLLVPDYVEHSGDDTSYVIAGTAIVVAFFHPFVWWRTTLGYLAGVVFGIISVVTSIVAIIDLVPDEIPYDSLAILVPALILGLLLVGASVLAWRESSPRAVGD